jgi:hypothetical protein
MKIRRICCILAVLSLFGVNPAISGPILRPRKYHGPIPQSSLSLYIGFHAGSTNEEMWNTLDNSIKPGGEAFTENFGSALTLDCAYTYKLHPQFGVRLNGALSLFRSDSKGSLVPNIPNLPDSVSQPKYEFTRTFNVELIMIEASSIYYFTDSGVNDFQPYLGAGFSAGFPRATYSEGMTDKDVVVKDTKDTEWSMEAGVHGLFGVLYYVQSNLAFSTEARYQIVQSKYPFVLNTNSGPQNVRFDVDYTGFVLTAGIVWAF